MRHISTAIAALLAVYAITAAGRAANQDLVRNSADLPPLAAMDSQAG